MMPLLFGESMPRTIPRLLVIAAIVVGLLFGLASLSEADFLYVGSFEGKRLRLVRTCGERSANARASVELSNRAVTVDAKSSLCSRFQSG